MSLSLSLCNPVTDKGYVSVNQLGFHTERRKVIRVSDMEREREREREKEKGGNLVRMRC